MAYYQSLLRYFLVILVGVFSLYLTLHRPLDDTTLNGVVRSVKSRHTNSTSLLSLAPGELPGYTGWGRPEFTLAGYFELVVVHNDNNNDDDDNESWSVESDQAFEFALECRGHTLCSSQSSQSASSWFYVRAYGPSVVAGRVEGTTNPGTYNVVLGPVVDPGIYTVEVVLTFSNPPSIESFPLKDESSHHVNYEGYLILGFPRTLVVKPASSSSSNLLLQEKNLPLCNVEDLTVRHVDEGMNQGRWKVVDMVRHVNHPMQTEDSKFVSLPDYQQSWNSIGVAMEYQFRSCRLLPMFSTKINPFRCVALKQQSNGGQEQPIFLHIILIGDSVMRLQHQLLLEMVSDIPEIRVEYIEITGGYFLTQLLRGPKLRPLLLQQQQQQQARKRIILFNTGMHDIHRLCGSEYASERKTYLHGDMQTTSCASLYRLAVTDLTRAIQESSSHGHTTALFQTTTAAWPKYGNYGINWDPQYGQPLPLDPGFVYHFNRIAIDVLRPLVHKKGTLVHKKGTPTTSTIQFFIIDAYWITLARPDNREIKDKDHIIGPKLSHPGVEVTQTMAQIWSMIILQLICG